MQGRTRAWRETSTRRGQATTEDSVRRERRPEKGTLRGEARAAVIAAAATTVREAMAGSGWSEAASGGVRKGEEQKCGNKHCAMPKRLKHIKRAVDVVEAPDGENEEEFNK